MNIVVTTCDKQMHVLRGFAHLFNRYWSPRQPVTILGYSYPNFSLPDNFSFCSVGRQEDYPFAKWSDGLIDFLALHPHWDRFVLLLEDYYLVRAVDVEAVQMLYAYMAEHRDVIKMDLCADRLGASGSTDFAYLGRLDLIRSDPQSPYHWSWWPGIWNRDALLRVLRRGESCHDHELYGSARLGSHSDLHVLGTRQHPLRNLSVYKFSEPEKRRLAGLRESDVRELQVQGFL